MRKISIIFSLFASLLLGPRAWASPDIEMLKRDVATMRSNLDNMNAKLADAMNQLSTLQQEINSMKGVTESGNYFFNEQTRAIREYDQRVRALEDKITSLMTLLKEIKEGAGPVGKVGGADETQTREFQKLLDYVMSEDYNKALPGLQAFLQKYSKGPFADHAEYWIAESYYGLGDFKKAIAEFQVLIQKYPRSAKVKTAVLKQGLSFMSLKMYPEARPFFEKVVAEYPNTAESAQASGRIKEIDRLVAQATPTATAPANPPGAVPPSMTPPAATSPSPTPNLAPSPSPSSLPPPSPTPTNTPPPPKQPRPTGFYD